MGKDPIIVARKGPVVHVVNNNPSSKNSLTDGFVDGFTELLDGLARDRGGARAVVLSGAEGFFCSGGNVDGLRERSQGDYEARRGTVERIHGLIKAMRGCELPLIAAVEGGAAGAGIGLALACDLVYAAEDAFVMAAYVKIGITPDGGLTAFMTEGMPRWLLAELAFTGDRMPVRRLHELGIVNEVTAKGGAEAAALAMAERLAKGPSGAIAEAKRLISSARLAPLADQLDDEGNTVAEALGSGDGKEGISAFLEKRKPDFG